MICWTSQRKTNNINCCLFYWFAINDEVPNEHTHHNWYPFWRLNISKGFYSPQTDFHPFPTTEIIQRTKKLVTLFNCYVTGLFSSPITASLVVSVHSVFSLAYLSDSDATSTVAGCVCPTQLKLLIKRAPTLRQIHIIAFCTVHMLTCLSLWLNDLALWE